MLQRMLPPSVTVTKAQDRYRWNRLWLMKEKQETVAPADTRLVATLLQSTTVPDSNKLGRERCQWGRSF